MIEKGFMEGIGTAVQDWAQTRNRMRLMSDCCGVHRRAFVSFSVYRAREVSSAYQRLVNADLYRGEASQNTDTRRALAVFGGTWIGSASVQKVLSPARVTHYKQSFFLHVCERKDAAKGQEAWDGGGQQGSGHPTFGYGADLPPQKRQNVV